MTKRKPTALRIRGITRLAEDERSLLLCCDRRPSDDEMRQIQDSINARRWLPVDADPDRRCDSNLVGFQGDCIACGAIQGEACRAPRKLPRSVDAAFGNYLEKLSDPKSGP